MNKKHLLAVLAYMLPTFPLAYLWHLTIFAGYYKSLHVYREDIIIPFIILSMLVQGNIWAVIYRRLFSREPILRGALRFASLAAPLAWSFMALAVCAKHPLTSPMSYLGIETCFILVQYAITSPLIAWVYRSKSA